MEIVSKSPELVEIHVKVTRQELDQLRSDMDADCTASDPYPVTLEFYNYLSSLTR